MALGLAAGRSLRAAFAPNFQGFGLRYRSSVRAAAAAEHDLDVRPTPLKTIQDLPGYGLLTGIYWNILRGYLLKTHELQIVHKEIFGPIWKSQFGPLIVINVANAELIEQILRQEGKYPLRSYMPHWREYRELRGHAYGPLCEYGLKWYQMRRMLNPKLLQPKAVINYAPAINEVVSDFVKKIERLRESQGDGVTVKDLSNELYKFAFEAITMVLFGTRIGCLADNVPQETQNFISAVGEMFHLSAILIFFPKAMWPYLSIWKKFVKAWDYLFFVAKKLVDKKIAQIEEWRAQGLPLEDGYLIHLLSNNKMTPIEIYGSLTELLLAGVDTTSNTISWALYNLAREASIQDQLYTEISSLHPGEQIPTTSDFSKMPLLKATIKETLRMYPVVPGNARVTVDKEVVVGDYCFPQNTLFHLCHYAVSYEDCNFAEPQRFKPERWLESKKQHPFSSIPFGFGLRTCIGKRVAELEMYSVLSTLINRFEVRPDPSGKRITAKTRTLLCPGDTMNLQFIDRR
uniref:Sterol 26-hydroxylase, mitochondrial-like protein n=1 Tax=Callorhinchus milii TaxID=7868 RepID=V9KHM1_CALMI